MVGLPKWRLISSDPLVWKSWDDDEHVVYHPGTGDTHILNDVAAELLFSLDEVSLSCEELAVRCADAFGITSDEAFQRQIQTTLDQFDDLGLIETAT